MSFSKCYYCPFIMCKFCNKCCIKSYPQHMDHFEYKYRYTNENLEDELNAPTLHNLKADPYLDEFRAPQNEVNRILKLLTEQQRNIYSELSRYGINRRTSDYLLRLIIGYVIDNEQKYPGNESQKVNSLFKDFQKNYRPFLLSLEQGGIPRNKLEELIKRTIRFTLNNLKEQPSGGWSKWEDLGGDLTSGPGASSWQPNRLDVFVRGTDNAMYHKFWNGSTWSNWESLGGALTSSPAAVSWGRNRIDTFVRGTDNAMYHKFWNGSTWSDWENLGGVLTSAPAVSSWSANRLDCFVRGTDNQLYHKWWDGSKWSDWEALGGVLTSGPAAVSWGPNRIDVFSRGQNNAMWHIWWDGSKWSKWEDLGGNLTSDPAASSRGVNKIDCFAKGRNNELIYKSWDGARWSDWRGLDGILTSEPDSVSWGPNRIDVFTRGQNNHLWHIWRG